MRRILGNEVLMFCGVLTRSLLLPCVMYSRAIKGTLKALWEETLIFNENLTYFTENDNVVIFFEIVDFVVVGGGYTKKAQSEHKPWHRIAWAFLRPSGKTCRKSIGKKLRLQLYRYPKKAFEHSTESAEVS